MSMNQIFAIDIVAMLALQSILHRAHIAHIVFQQLTYPARLQKGTDLAIPWLKAILSFFISRLFLNWSHTYDFLSTQ